MPDVAGLQAEAGPEIAFFGMRHPDNPPLPLDAAFPSFVELKPPTSSLRRRVTAAARMVSSPASRRGIEAVVRAFRPDVAHLHNIYHQLSPSVLRPCVTSASPPS
jgi:hypothetical protein